MTDYEKLKELLTSFGVGITEKIYDDIMLINCECGDEKVSGYAGFFTSFLFDNHGKFLEVGAWE